MNRLLAPAVALVAGLAVGVLVVGWVLRPVAPAEGSVDAGFARDMQVHHAQAVELATLVRDRTDDEDVRRLALDILLTQQQQQGQMFGWLASWGLPQASTAPAMAWAEHGHDTGGTAGAGAAPDAMPGLVSDAQLAVLEASTGVEAERVFLALMIPHHEGGVEMAELAVDRAARPEVRTLASSIVTSQRAEIAVLEEMLADRGGAPGGLLDR